MVWMAVFRYHFRRGAEGSGRASFGQDGSGVVWMVVLYHH